MSWRAKLGLRESSDASDRSQLLSLVSPEAIAPQTTLPACETPRTESGPEVWLPWEDWKAEALNRLFQEQGVTGQPGRITGATVLHGEKKMKGEEDAEDLWCLRTREKF